MALMPWWRVSKPTSKFVNASRLGNQNSEDNQSQRANQALSFNQSIISFFASTLSLYVFFPASLGGVLMTTFNLGLPDSHQFLLKQTRNFQYASFYLLTVIFQSVCTFSKTSSF